jgi:hypothetical protein
MEVEEVYKDKIKARCNIYILDMCGIGMGFVSSLDLLQLEVGWVGEY